MTLTVEHRFRGPTSSGNGGYVSGLVAAAVGPGRVTVTLRRAPPLGLPMDVVRTPDAVVLAADGVTVAEAQAGGAEPEAVEPVAPAEAAATAEHFAGLHLHPFPECFVCGTDRDPRDALCLRPGRLGDGRTACVWTVAVDLAGRAELVWAALDCPGGWTAPIEGRPMVLGQMTARVDRAPEAGEPVVVMGKLLGQDGRKYYTATTAYGPDGDVLGLARATWILLRGADDRPEAA
jgi:hypothetical protein